MALQPHSGMPYWLLGGQALKEIRPAEAIRFFQTACDKEPERSDFCLALGLAYLAPGTPEDLSRARLWMERAATLDPQAPAPYQHLGQILEQMGRLDAARDCDLRSLDL
jgi:Flp pilus assembly protein TadD